MLAAPRGAAGEQIAISVDALEITEFRSCQRALSVVAKAALVAVSIFAVMC
jgi:hypothetical protein